ncbi:MAG: NTP transferase domain-containing protein [Acidimicrobiaceae bacterium]
MVAAQRSNPTTSAVTAVLLAAGSGSRFSGEAHKLLTVIGGQTVFAWALQNCLAAQFQHLIVVTGAVDLSAQISDAEIATTNLIEVHNENWQTGMASSLQCAISEAQRHGASSIVVGLADQPAIKPSSWQRIANATAPLAVATYNGVRGNPVRIHAELWPLLPSTGDEGARSLFKSHKDLLEEVACDGSSQDLDTSSDIETLTKLLNK